MIARSAPGRIRPKPIRGNAAARPPRRHVLDQGLFRGALVRERKRSDRSGAPFGLLRVEAADHVNGAMPLPWSVAIDALLAASRNSDIAGWLEDQMAIGVIVGKAGASTLSDACDKVEARFRRELVGRAGARAAATVSIRRHFYPEAKRPGEPYLWPVDAALHPDADVHRSRGIGDTLKRVLDVIGSLALLTLLSPLLLAMAGAVKLTSPGSVLFKQVRIGRMTKTFRMLKFRTMYSGADHRLHHEFVTAFIGAGANGHDGLDAGGNGFFKLVDDPRVTPLGRVLRKTSLDELPQLWNVLRGDMSLVGPRPALPYELEHYKTWHRRRILEAKPGITGPWQVNGRSRTTFDEMVRLDLRYARERSLWLDVRTLLATPGAVISGDGAC